MGVAIREIRPDDRGWIEEMLGASGAFSQEEVGVALDIVDHGLVTGTADYIIFVAEKDETGAGYICAGQTPLTRTTWHIYWLCVHPVVQRQGIASALQVHMEEYIRARGGQRVVIETSGRPDYSAAREFYRRSGYIIAGRIPDYYKPGDDLLIEWKPL